MHSLLAFAIALTCETVGILVGAKIRRSVPDTHLQGDAKDVVKLATGLTATMTALVLGLFLSSANTTFNTQFSNVATLTANIARLDLVLDHYGPETGTIRAELRSVVPQLVARVWAPQAATQPLHPMILAGRVYDGIVDLKPSTPPQAQAKADAQAAYEGIIGAVMMIDTRNNEPLQWPFFGLLSFWLLTIFATFSMCVDLNKTVLGALALCAFAVSSSLYLIYELGQPFSGLLMVKSDRLLSILPPLG